MKRSRGFTLIELLVVIAIIAILAAILFPLFARIKERGRQITCINNLTQLDRATKMYGADNNDKFPMAWEWTSGHPTEIEALYPRYLSSLRTFQCPTDFGNTTTPASPPYWQTYGSSYGYPGLSVYRPAVVFPAAGLKCTHPYLAGLSESNPMPGNVTDSTYYDQSVLWIWKLPPMRRPEYFDHNPWHGVSGIASPGNRLSAQGFNNLVFCDGHAAPMQYQSYLVLLGLQSGPHPY